ncbi:hypothetical protein M9Y10_039570 [Tritrichomonas musculus]|uniref:Myb-like DNA-binding domain containing protein n=1 Tax=Tritrichomonas musculus TaxID=1915356 RepID=A0ABR2KBJ7_9EUKA
MLFPTSQYYYTSYPCLFPCHPCNLETSQRNRFTHEEDENLKRLVSFQDPPNWNEIARFMRHRTPRQCRERYNNYLRPDLVNGSWTPEEDELLNRLYEKYGPKWSLIAQSFKGRSAVNIKNHHSSLVSQMSVKNRSNRFVKTKSTSDFATDIPAPQQFGWHPIQQHFASSVPSEQIELIDKPKVEEVKIEKEQLNANSNNEEKHEENEDNMFSNFNFEQDELFSNSLQLSMPNDDIIVF